MIVSSSGACAGDVLLLTTPVSAGYTQNPISVYYCMGAAGRLRQGIAEVTNTPWGERVTFLFHPEGQDVPKAMHVSPLMDMKSTWCAAFPPNFLGSAYYRRPAASADATPRDTVLWCIE